MGPSCGVSKARAAPAWRRERSQADAAEDRLSCRRSLWLAATNRSVSGDRVQALRGWACLRARLAQRAGFPPYRLPPVPTCHPRLRGSPRRCPQRAGCRTNRKQTPRRQPAAGASMRRPPRQGSARQRGTGEHAGASEVARHPPSLDRRSPRRPRPRCLPSRLPRPRSRSPRRGWHLDVFSASAAAPKRRCLRPGGQ